MKKNIIKIRILLWGMLFFVVAWLFWMAVAPGGKIAYKQDFLNKKYFFQTDKDYFIRRFTPGDRVEIRDDNKPRIVGDPVYFSLRTPRAFNTAKITYKYKIQEKQPIHLIETGALADRQVWRYQLHPLENKTIDQLSEVWNKIEEQGTVLLQKTKNYENIADFLASPPDFESIAVYNYDLPYDYKIGEFATGTEEHEYSVPLRGAFQFYTYIKGDALDFSFDIKDINQNGDADNVDLFVYYKNTLLASEHLPDDGISIENNQVSENRVLNINIPNLPEGAYKLEMKANNDIVAAKIRTHHQKIAFINKINLHKTDKEDIKIFTDAKELQATTIYPESLQSLKAGENRIELNETYRQFSGVVEKGTSTENLGLIQLEKDGVELAGEGVFCFAPELCFNPALKQVKTSLDKLPDNIDYIIADYGGISYDGEWHIASAEIDLTSAYREDKAYSIILSIPGLRADDAFDDGIIIDNILVELAGKSLAEKVKSIFN